MHRYHFANNTLPITFSHYFNLNSSIHGYDTRSKSDYHLGSFKTNLGQKSFLYQGSYLWNTLPDSLKLIGSINQFKKNIKPYLLHNYFES